MVGKDREPHSTQEGEQHQSQLFSFQEGNKLLHLTVHIDNATAFTTIRKTEDPYEAGATTKVYERARDAIKEIAAMSQGGIFYQFYTEDRKLSAWAKDPEKGQKVFEWDEVIDYADGVYALKYFPPALEQSGS